MYQLVLRVYVRREGEGEGRGRERGKKGEGGKKE